MKERTKKEGFLKEARVWLTDSSPNMCETLDSTLSTEEKQTQETKIS